jgi:hypothetical protein
MFTVMQETESGQKLWPGVDHVYTCTATDRPHDIRKVTILFKAGGLMDFPASRGVHNIYVMNESGATVARYHLGSYSFADEPVEPMGDALPKAAD